MAEIKDMLALGVLAHKLKNPKEQIDNSKLYSGSLMYFYCKMCRYISDVKDEHYTDHVKRYCAACVELKKANPEILEEQLIEMARSMG